MEVKGTNKDMTRQYPNLNALLGSRIYHDLISPLGAIGNGFELLVMSGIAASTELELVEHSVESANTKIRFFFALLMGLPIPHKQLAEMRSQAFF